jgi:hypothetical protein
MSPSKQFLIVRIGARKVMVIGNIFAQVLEINGNTKRESEPCLLSSRGSVQVFLSKITGEHLQQPTFIRDGLTFNHKNNWLIL